ncbi:MAG: UDP-N-acetylmuramate dehydrogenase [Planctomycetota bacterium]
MMRQNVDLSSRTSFRIGGVARLFATPTDSQQLQHLLLDARGRGLPVFILGGGTNTLIHDGVYDGLVICTRALTAISFDSETFRLRAEAGVPLSQVIRVAIEQGAAGLEAFTGIPGTIGGAVYGNAGGAGLWIDRVVRSLEVIDAECERRWIAAEECDWRYRSSGLAQKVVATVELQLARGVRAELRDRARSVYDRKRATQPLSARSAGCVFRNPGAANSVRTGESAGALIERAGLKGIRVGGAAVSNLHANFIVNETNASAQNVLELVHLVQQQVRERLGVELEREIISPCPSGGWSR